VRVSVDVRPCTVEDIDRLRAQDLPPQDIQHHEERWTAQQSGEAIYLLAWQGNVVVGRVTLLFRSKYPEVTRLLGEVPEMNALEARPQGQGIGTATIGAAEHEAARRGASVIGLAVELGNDGARRLYERLGYVEWDHGLVVDRWKERDDRGEVVREHADECFYFTKRLGR
jgi:GNAT superfamily N-acetyltransferase